MGLNPGTKYFDTAIFSIPFLHFYFFCVVFFMHRLFIAIDFPDKTRDDLANLCFGIPGARWTSKDQMHCTIRFIGDTDDAELEETIDILESVNRSRFSLNIKGVGYFPPRRKPNIIWAGIELSEPFSELKDSIELRMQELGYENEERKYHPHITLARLRQESPIDRIMGFISANALLKFPDIPINEFHLYSSTLTPDGAVHTKEASFSLI